MSKRKAIICSVLLAIAIFAFYFLTNLVKLSQELTLYYFVTCVITGLWTADKIEDFYYWLRNRK